MHQIVVFHTPLRDSESHIDSAIGSSWSAEPPVYIWWPMKPVSTPPANCVFSRASNRWPKTVRQTRSNLILHMKRNKRHKRTVCHRVSPVQFAPRRPKERSHVRRPCHRLETAPAPPIARSTRTRNITQTSQETSFVHLRLQLDRREDPCHRVYVDPHTRPPQYSGRKRAIASSTEWVENEVPRIC